ncbi:adenylate/guanylate cyclase domain-containing protein [Litoribrevibacter albus]|uniref:Guanylate cyclase n=1 Tax=Litoribrevibacter albus TaxID=1473156 RepID=A0AA37S896_9GAMM|nr:adenylate/guanylate cyclase domain-containing protein [Litoribrevibacter albus]GLQ30181.1 guanylate cyclase [Litoribrevibacter albus]
MKDSAFHQWLYQYDPSDKAPDALLERFMSGVNELGIDVYRASMWLPTSHPELWGTQLVWCRGQPVQEFRRGHDITDTPIYLNTPGEAVHKERQPLRWQLTGEDPLPYPLLDDVKQEGGTDYLIVPFHTDHEKEQPWITFATKRESGFSRLELSTLKELCEPLSWKARVTMAEMATKSLLSVYLGENASNRVMNGQFKRGTGEAIDAVIWFCDLRGFTSLGDTLPCTELVALLDHYFECVSEPIEAAGGEILKFIGDAILAIFPLSSGASEAHKQTVCLNALAAAEEALANVASKSWCGHTKEALTLSAGIALHIGTVTYGNIGGSSRLDFTVIGAAVNEAARVEALCKDYAPLLATEAFQSHLPKDRMSLVGDVSLRGVSKSLRLYTLPSCAD